MTTISPTLEAIWTGFAGRLKQFIRARVSDDASADDILQDVFLKIHSRLGTLEDPAKLEGWIYLITRNAIIDFYRTRKPTSEISETLPAEAPENDVDLDQLKTAFRRMIQNLPEPYRQALVFTEFEGLTQKELAEKLGISISGAKSRVQRGRAQLKEMLHACCTFEFDRRGRVIECNPRTKEGCKECD